MEIKSNVVGRCPDGSDLVQFEMVNAGFRAVFLSYGARLHSWEWKTSDAKWVDVIVGCRDIGECLKDRNNHGVVVGRVANRIRDARFPLDGAMIELETNDFRHHLHGGRIGFSHRNWQGECITGKDRVAIRFSIFSPDGDQGYPGNLVLHLTCALSEDGVLSYEFDGSTDAPTILNPTAHPYFNLAGVDALGYEDDHLLQLFASSYLPSARGGLPTGEILTVEGTPYDFRELRSPREPADADGRLGRFGYNQTWVIDGLDGTLRPAANVVHTTSGRKLEVWTTEPGIHFYNGNYTGDTPALMKGGDGQPRSRTGFALEAQHFPDAPNHPHFPSIVLRPGEVYSSQTEYRAG